MRRKLVPLARRHAVQAKVAVVVDRTVHWAALILMHVGSDKGRPGRPHRSSEYPRDTNRAVLAHEQTVALPLVLFQQVDTKALQHAQQGVHGALETPRLLARHHHRSGAHADILCHAGSLHGVPDVREVVRFRTLLPVVAERRDDAIAARKRLLQLLLFIQLRLDHRSRRLHVLELVRRPCDHHRLDSDLLGPGEDPLAVGSAGADDRHPNGLRNVRVHDVCVPRYDRSCSYVGLTPEISGKYRRFLSAALSCYRFNFFILSSIIFNK